MRGHHPDRQTNGTPLILDGTRGCYRKLRGMQRDGVPRIFHPPFDLTAPKAHGDTTLAWPSYGSVYLWAQLELA
jgi:hypothetical protein